MVIPLVMEFTKGNKHCKQPIFSIMKIDLPAEESTIGCISHVHNFFIPYIGEVIVYQIILGSQALIKDTML